MSRKKKAVVEAEGKAAGAQMLTHPTLAATALLKTDSVRINSGRQHDKAAVAVMADSIRRHREAGHPSGLLQPITVKPAGPGMYELVFGNCRLAAWRQVYGGAPIPAFVITMDETQHQVMTLDENVSRRQMTTAELLAQYKLITETWKDSGGRSGEEVAEILGVDLATFKALASLEHLSPDWIRMLDRGNDGLTILQAAYIASLPVNVQAFLHAHRHEIDLTDRTGKSVPVAAFMAQVRELTVANLGTASWDLDDAKLLPAAGACSKCPKREGALELWGGAKTTCLDRNCFVTKQALHLTITIKQETGKAPAVFLKATDHADRGVRERVKVFEKAGGAVSVAEYWEKAPEGKAKPGLGTKPLVVIQDGEAKVIHVAPAPRGAAGDGAEGGQGKPAKTQAEKEEALKGLRLNVVASLLIDELTEKRARTVTMVDHMDGAPVDADYLLGLCASFDDLATWPQVDDPAGVKERYAVLDDLCTGNSVDLLPERDIEGGEPKAAPAREVMIRRVYRTLKQRAYAACKGAAAGVDGEFDLRLLARLLGMDWDGYLWLKACEAKPTPKSWAKAAETI